MPGGWKDGICWDTGDRVTGRIIVAGDWGPIWNYERPVLREPLAVYGDLLPELRAADLRIVNVETPLSRRGRAILKDGPNLRGRPEAIASLAAVPFDVACLANNHIFDYGPAAFADTTRSLRKAGIRFLGAGLTEEEAVAPLVVRVGVVRIGIVNFCEGEDLTAARGGPGTFGWDIERVSRTVVSLSKEAQVVLVIAHAGREYTPLPPPYIVEAFRRIAEAGADAVIAHHPHVPQGIEVWNGVPIIYSLGNFVFSYRTESFYQKVGYLAELRLSGRWLSGLRLIPYRVAPGGLELMRGRALRWFLGRIRRISVPLAKGAAVRAAWEAFIDRRIGEGAVGRLERMLGRAKKAPASAAKVRNFFATPAHREFWIDAMTRLGTGRVGTAPQWARSLVDEWLMFRTNDARSAAGNAGGG